MTHREAKGHIRAFMQVHYTDERLAQLLAHAQQGRLEFHSCCCFIGITTADHALATGYKFGQMGHYLTAKAMQGAVAAEEAFLRLDMSARKTGMIFSASANRSRILIPMVRAEMRRRGRKAIAERAAAVPAQEIAAALVSAHMVAR